MVLESLGLIDYVAARSLQEIAVAKLLEEAGKEIVYFCEHPPLITLGRRSKPGAVRDGCRLPVFHVLRGGEATLHAPGQVVIYPVVSFRKRGLSVRELVYRLLAIAQSALHSFELETEVCLDPAGLFTKTGKKIAAIGLELKHGVSNHGVAINIANDIEMFSSIIPCGRVDILPTSLSIELKRRVGVNEVLPHLRKSIVDFF